MSTIRFRSYEGPIRDDLLWQLVHAALQIFDSFQLAEFSVRQLTDKFACDLNGFRWVYLLCAYDDDELVVYKAGRSNDPRTFESWNGGVLPSARQQGIGTELARRQEAWCGTQGFRYLTTETAYDNRTTLFLNLRQGIHIAGTYLDREKNKYGHAVPRVGKRFRAKKMNVPRNECMRQMHMLRCGEHLVPRGAFLLENCVFSIRSSKI